jgi:hypothetical protein
MSAQTTAADDYWPFEPNPQRDAWATAQALAAPPLREEQIRALAPLFQTSTTRTAS